MAQLKNEKVGIVGSGLIGKSWAMIFASEGFNVVLFDVDQNQVTKAIQVKQDQYVWLIMSFTKIFRISNLSWISSKKLERYVEV